MKNTVIAIAVACTMSVSTSYAQQMQGGLCKEVNNAPDTVGCWIIAHDKIGTLQNAQTHWHIDTYPSEVAAMSAKGPRGSVLRPIILGGRGVLRAGAREAVRNGHQSRVLE